MAIKTLLVYAVSHQHKHTKDVRRKCPTQLMRHQVSALTATKVVATGSKHKIGGTLICRLTETKSTTLSSIVATTAAMGVKVPVANASRAQNLRSGM